MNRAAGNETPTQTMQSPLCDRLIICIASSWDLDPTSKHHVMRILSRDNDVLWVNYHGSRRPSLNAKDAASAWSALKRVASGLKPIHKRMSQLTPLVLPGVRDARWRALNQRLVVSQIRRAVRAIKKPNQPVQLWTFAPDVDFLAGRFDEERLVYYCVDEFAAFEGFDAKAIEEAEARLLDRADVVLATSAQLYESRTTKHPNVHLVRHGVDHPHFASVLENQIERHEALRNISKPIAGFIGLIDHWFDVPLMSKVAKRLPDISFVMVGDTRVDVQSLEALPNVHFVGRKPYADLPAYCAAFDLGLIPFVRNHLTDNVNPIKLREYLAAGLPVVSTNLPEVRRYEKFVSLTDDAETFAAHCRSAIDRDTITNRKKRSDAVAVESWESVTNRIRQIVCDAKCATAKPACNQPSQSIAPA